jgi:hypothetical protein
MDNFRKEEKEEILESLKEIPIEESGKMPDKSVLKKSSKEREKEQPLLQHILKN